MGKLGRLKKALQHCWKQYRKRGKQLEKGAKQEFTEAFHELEEAITKRDVTRGKVWREKLEDLCKTHIPRSWLRATVELVVAIAVALAIATVIRQSWFELYEIPTGSMRPTFREQDHLSVTKTPFGINIPLETEHFYFDPDLVQRGSVVIFSTDKMPVADSDTTFFGIFPYKKRLVKRMIGKPGDTLYFYGGKIYGLDSEGNPIDILLNEPSIAKLDHIPFISFEGTPSQPKRDQIVFSQMNIPVGRLTRRPTGDWQATVFQGNKWLPETPGAYSNTFGMNNFAFASLEAGPDDSDALMTLKLVHSPTLQNPEIVKMGNRSTLKLHTTTTTLPLHQRHLDRLFDTLYTARFDVKRGYADKYFYEALPAINRQPQFAEVPDGRYEFYYGKGYQVHTGAILSALPADHPLMQRTSENLKRLVNYGIQFDTTLPTYALNRYAYFRDGALYIMGGKVFDADDPLLQEFITAESTKTTPFLDHGRPTPEKIRSLGITVPPKHYLVLGDNHAMSGDSRVFGFVPEANLQGAPSIIMWPPFDRLGMPNQRPYPIFVTPRLIVWVIAGTIGLIWYIIHRRRTKIAPETI